MGRISARGSKIWRLLRYEIGKVTRHVTRSTLCEIIPATENRHAKAASPAWIRRKAEKVLSDREQATVSKPYQNRICGRD
jgi:hypothetical protein